MTTLADPWRPIASARPMTEVDANPAALDAGASTTSVASSRVAALGVMVFAATLPLQWQTLADVPGVGTLRYFHLGALVMIVLARPSPRRMLAMIRRSRPIPEGLAAFLACLTLTAIGYHSGVSEYVQVMVYIALGLLGGACVITALAHRQGRLILAFASIVSLLTFSIFFYRSMVSAGVDPETTIVRAVVTGDPTVIEYSLFRASFNGASEGAGDVRSNTRHEIFAALIIIFCLSLAAGAAIRSCRIVLIVSAILTLAMVVISQSRSNLLAVGIALALCVVRLIVYRHIRAGTIGLAVVVIVVTTIVFPSVIQLVVNRVTNTTSYDARLSAWNIGTDQILRRVAFGGPELDVSTHTMFGDALLRGGVMAALGAVIVILGFLRIAWTELRLFFRTNRIEYFTTMMIMSIVVVRAWTAGGGRLHLTEWFGLGVVLALQVTRATRLGAGYDDKRASAEASWSDELQTVQVAEVRPAVAGAKVLTGTGAKAVTAGGTTGSPTARRARAADPTPRVPRARPVRSAR